jgi:flavin-dependent dehydrogenase
VVVLGGGPAGSTVATLLAGRGHQVVLLEKERFPRFKIGESLMPATYWPFEKTGMLEKLQASDQVVKASVQFISASGKASRPFYFYERNPHPSSYTWQVERAWFDAAYLEHAADRGVEVHLEAAATGLLLEGDRVEGVEVTGPDGSVQALRSRVLVDATGLSSLVSRKLELRRRDPRLGRAAVFSHYENGHRDAGIDEGATLVIHTADGKGWFWYIPLSGNRVSVGVVGYPSDLFRNGESHDEVLEREIRACPAVAGRLERARKLVPAQVVSDYSYRSTRAAGEGWVLVGDSLGFLDPIYSSGVLLALKSAELAADSVSRALRSGDVSAERLGGFAPEIRRGMEAIRNLVYAFYTPGFSFGDFFTEHPQHRDRVTDILIGDVFKGGVMDIFDDLKHYCELPEPARR